MITIIFITIAAILNAIMDMISVKYKSTIFSLYPKLNQFFNGSVSWVNKYKDKNPKKGPAFPFAMGPLVFLTDMWHLSKTLMLIFFSLAIVFYTPIFGIIDFFIFWNYFGVIFTIFYDYLLRKKFWGIN
jgi:hypothetical protein